MPLTRTRRGVNITLAALAASILIVLFVIGLIHLRPPPNDPEAVAENSARTCLEVPTDWIVRTVHLSEAAMKGNLHVEAVLPPVSDGEECVARMDTNQGLKIVHYSLRRGDSGNALRVRTWEDVASGD